MLKGKNAIVTGGSRGIGAAICRIFAENGANVAFLYAKNRESAESLEKELSGLGVKVKAYQCDVSDYDAVAAVFKTILEDFGSAQILVNNAGITRDNLVVRMSLKDFDSVIETNLKAAFNTIKQLYPLFMRQRSGKIINISSVSGLIGNSGQANYSSSKAGLIGLTKSVAKELGSRGVCVNAVAPGFIDTEMTQSLSEKTKEAIMNQIPLGRMGSVADVAGVVGFLAGSSGDYITGQVICVDGGMTMR